MSFLSSLMKGVGAGLMTGSFAGGLTAATSNSFWAGLGVGVTDNFTGGSISRGMTGMWGGNYGYGNFYGGNYGMDFMGANMYSNYGNYFGNSFGNNYFGNNYGW